MESMLQTQEELKQGSQKINSMLQEMENKKVSFVNQCMHELQTASPPDMSSALSFEHEMHIYNDDVSSVYGKKERGWRHLSNT